MHTLDRTGLQQENKRSRKALFLLIAMALLIASLLTLLIATPTQAISRRATQPPPSQQTPPPTPTTCPNGVPDAHGNCTTFTPGNQQIHNPIANHSPLLFFTSLDYTVNQPQVQQLWTVSLWIVDICLSLTLVLNGITIILGGSVMRNAKVIESLPGVFLALIAAHVSMLFMVIFITMNNVICTDVFNWTDNPKNVKPNTTTTATTPLDVTCMSPNPLDFNRMECTYTDGTPVGRDFHLDTDLGKDLQKGFGRNNDYVYDQPLGPQAFTITPKNLDLGHINITEQLKTLGGALSLMVTISSLMLISQVIVRFFYLDLYIVLAPIGLACWALPGRAGQPLTRSWFKGFLSTVFVQFIQVIAIIVIQVMLSGLMVFLIDPNRGAIDNELLPTNQLIQLINVVLLWFILRVPALLNVAPMRGMMEIGQTITQAANTVISIQIMQSQANSSMQLGGETMTAGTVAGVATQMATRIRA